MEIGKSWSGDIHGIVLDAVGTLVEPHPSVAETYRAAAQRQGIALDAEQVRGRFLRSFRDDERDESLGPLRTDEALERRRWRRIVEAVLPEVPDPLRAFDELWEHFGAASAWRCFPDVGPTVAWLCSSGLKVCIGSNFDSRLRTVVAGLPELAPLSPSLVISSEVGYRKPHEGFFDAACKRLDIERRRVLCVGDDLKADVEGATRAGLRGILLDRSRESGEGRLSSLSEIMAGA